MSCRIRPGTQPTHASYSTPHKQAISNQYATSSMLRTGSSSSVQVSQDDHLLPETLQKSAKQCHQLMGRVHAGWKHGWDCVEAATSLLVDRITERDSSWTVFTTGHSLGGALATVAADAFACRKYANISSHRGQRPLAPPESPEAEQQHAPHITAPFASPRGIPRGFGGAHRHAASPPDLYSVPEHRMHSRVHATVGHLPPAYPSPHPPDPQCQDGHCGMQGRTHGGGNASEPQVQCLDGSHDGTSKVSTYDMRLCDGPYMLPRSHWVHTTRSSVANPQKGFRNR